MLADDLLPVPPQEESTSDYPVWRRYWFLAPEHLAINSNRDCMHDLQGCREHKPWEVSPDRLTAPHPSLVVLCSEGSGPPVGHRFELFWYGMEYAKQKYAIAQFEAVLERLNQGQGKLQELLHTGNPFSHTSASHHLSGRMPYKNRSIPHVFSDLPQLQAYVDEYLPFFVFVCPGAFLSLGLGLGPGPGLGRGGFPIVKSFPRKKKT